jgi:hypothetical protein
VQRRIKAEEAENPPRRPLGGRRSGHRVVVGRGARRRGGVVAFDGDEVGEALAEVEEGPGVALLDRGICTRSRNLAVGGAVGGASR